MLRSLSAAVLALAICACEPSLPQVAPTPTVTAVFDPTASKIPLPNDLVFLAPKNTVCPAPGNGFLAPTDPPKCAQAELIAAFGGKFPSDQELPITIDFTKNTYDNGRLQLGAPDLDLTTITPATLAVIGPSGAVELETPTATDYVKGEDHGTLTVHRKGHLPWAPGDYQLVMRGGDMGVKTTDSPAILVTPSPVFDLIEQGKDMTLPENLGLLKAQSNGSTMDALSQGQQLNALIAIYKASAFPAADKAFGQGAHAQMAIASTFQIDTTVTNVTVDPARGLAPLPFDLLRDPTSHKLTPTAACAFLGTPLDKTGNCPNPAAAGFLALDGFSTTGAILAPTFQGAQASPIQAATVTASSLQLFDLTDPKNPVQVPPQSLIVEPCEFTSAFNATAGACVPSQIPTAAALAIALQPAGATTGDPTSVFRTRPLKDNTDYAVVMTNDIKDVFNKPLGQSTVAKILQFTNPVYSGGHSALQGIDDTTALGLDNMRKLLAPVFPKVGGTSKVAMAYTFHTQTVLSQATDLGALPYSLPAVTALPSTASFVAETPTDAFTKFGVVGPQSSHIDEILEVDITTFNLLDPATGAFKPDPKMFTAEPIHVLIATPKITSATVPPPCADPLGALRCSPMMVFRHGLSRGRADMLLIADAFAAAGMTTVAIDAAKHGDRTLCNTHPDPADPNPANKISGCKGVCTALPGAAGQGDPATPGAPGTCDSQGLLKNPVTPAGAGSSDGIAVLSGNYLISANFFRTRDSMRQDVIDQSQLVRAIAFVPPATLSQRTGHAVFDHMFFDHPGVIIDPGKVYFSGQSLGAIQGTVDVATNPRISKAGLNVGGGTLVDIFSNSPTFKPLFLQLLAGLGINPVTNPSGFLQFLTVAKTILDPADPVNFAGHITASTLPDLLKNQNRQTPQVAKQVLIQIANCDQVVPNPFGLVWSSILESAAGTPAVGTLPGPLPADFGTFFATDANGAFISKGPVQLFVGKDFVASNFLPPPLCTDTTAAGALAAGGGHGFLLSFEHADLTAAAQSSLAAFMMAGTLPLSVVRAQ